MTTSLPSVHDDDLLLDRLARREYHDCPGVGDVLQRWATSIDADAVGVSLTIDLPAEALPGPQRVASGGGAARLIRLSGSRLVAVLGTAALVSGASVAAALNGHEVPGVSPLLRQVRPIRGVQYTYLQIHGGIDSLPI